MLLDDIVGVLDSIAPLTLAQSWDKVGLQVAPPHPAAIARGLLCIDLTPAVVSEAVGVRAGMIVAYHPPIFEPITHLRERSSRDWKQRALAEALRHRMVVYSPHTALDAAEGGINDWLADGLIGSDRATRRAIEPAIPNDRPVSPVTADALATPRHKVVVFVPEGDAARVRDAMSRAGAGVIGLYRECSFESRGHGTFRGGSGSQPSVGRRGRFERVEEVRLEMVCPGDRLQGVQRAIAAAHPYEEPAFDVYPLTPTTPIHRLRGTNVMTTPSAPPSIGAGRLIEFERPVGTPALLRRLRGRLGVRSVTIARGRDGGTGRKPRRVSRLGLCVGAGGSLLDGAVAATDGRLDMFVTGEMRHHDVLDAVERGITVVLAGHTETERPYLPVYRRRLNATCGAGVRWEVSKADRSPLTQA